MLNDDSMFHQGQDIFPKQAAYVDMLASYHIFQPYSMSRLEDRVFTRCNSISSYRRGIW